MSAQSQQATNGNASNKLARKPLLPRGEEDRVEGVAAEPGRRTPAAQSQIALAFQRHALTPIPNPSPLEGEGSYSSSSRASQAEDSSGMTTASVTSASSTGTPSWNASLCSSRGGRA